MLQPVKVSPMAKKDSMPKARARPPTQDEDKLWRVHRPNPMQEEEKLSRWELLRICTPGSASQMGWAVMDALFAPFFLHLGIPLEHISILFFVSPVCSFVLRPLISMCVDRISCCGLRRVLIGFCGIVALLGFGFLMLTPIYFRMKGPNQTVMTVLVLFGALLMDLALDILTMPSRGLLNDRLPDSQISQGNTMYSMLGECGACVVLVLALFPLQNWGPFRTFHFDHTGAVAVLTMVLVVGAIVVGLTVHEDPIEEKSTGNEGLLVPDVENDDVRSDTSEGMGSGTSGSMEITSEEEEDPTLRDMVTALRALPRELCAVWWLQFMWWFGIMHLSFWWTVYVGATVFGGDPETSPDIFDAGVQWGIMGMIAQSVAAFFAQPLLYALNSWLGVTRVYHLGGALFAAAIAALHFFPTKSASLCLMILTGLLYPVIENNPFILVEILTRGGDDEEEMPANPMLPGAGSRRRLSLELSDEEEDDEFYSAAASRGVLTAVMNLTLPFAQFAAGLFSYFAVQYLPHFSGIFLIAGSTAFVFNVLVAGCGCSSPPEDEEETEQEKRKREEAELRARAREEARARAREDRAALAQAQARQRTKGSQDTWRLPKVKRSPKISRWLPGNNYYTEASADEAEFSNRKKHKKAKRTTKDRDEQDGYGTFDETRSASRRKGKNRSKARHWAQDTTAWRRMPGRYEGQSTAKSEITKRRELRDSRLRTKLSEDARSRTP